MTILLTLSSVIDIVHRRTRYYIKEDNVSKIFVELERESDTARVIIILDDNPNPTTLTSISVRYAHLFEDVCETYSFDVLGSVNHYKPDKDTYIIWRKGSGFIGEPAIWNSK